MTRVLRECNDISKQHVLEGLDDKDKFLRGGACYVLGSLWKRKNGNTDDDYQKELRKVITLLGDKEEFVREQAVRALWFVDKRKDLAVPALIKALEDKGSGVRSAAASTLGNLREDAVTAIPKLIEVTGDNKSGVRHSAVVALGDIGPKAKEGIPTLIKLLKDKSVFIGLSSAAAISRISSPDAKEYFEVIAKAKSSAPKDHQRLLGKALWNIDPQSAEKLGIPKE